MKQQRALRPSATRRGCKIYRMLVKAGDPGLAVGKLQSRLSIPASTLSHHLKTLIIVGLVSQERDATTLFCRANYPMMRGLVEFLVDECCTEADCASMRKQTDHGCLVVLPSISM